MNVEFNKKVNVSKLFCYTDILFNRGIQLPSIKVVIIMGYGCYGGYGYGYGIGSSFALIVVLFILLIIIGATIWSGY